MKAWHLIGGPKDGEIVHWPDVLTIEQVVLPHGTIEKLRPEHQPTTYHRYRRAGDGVLRYEGEA